MDKATPTEDETQHIKELMEDSTCDEMTNESRSGSESEIVKHSMDIEKAARRSILVSILVFFVGAIASATFLWVGISNEKDSKDDAFVKRSANLAKDLQAAMHDYELAASWIHESARGWREDGFTYDDFREVYEYISGSGLDFFAMEWCPNVTHAERPAVEDGVREWLKTFDESPITFEYEGIRGLLPEDPSTMEMVNRAEEPFYFPIQFFEPLSMVKGLYHYDVYSAPWEQPSVNLAIETWKPVATPAFKIVASGEQESFTTVLYHPGVPIEGHQPRDLSNILIQIKALLERAMRSQTESIGMYLFDKSEDMMFIGGMHALVHDQGQKDIIWFPDRITQEEVENSPNRLYQDDIGFASRTWTIYVLSVDDTYKPNITFVIISAVLIFAASLLLSFWMIHNMRRSIAMHRVITKAAAEASIVANLFPENIRKRLIDDAAIQQSKGKNCKHDVFSNNGNGKDLLCKDRLNHLTSEGLFGSKPIADFHPYTTIMFADLVGFTAWSSVREPSQVFTLLEIVYHAFDNIAQRRRVYKVETVGDCYVAVAGLPDPRKDHAVVMARFATDCLHRLNQLTKALETTLGPDTGDLGVRIGLHSGQVTAGVLRGDKGRFQLFGDTMNTASRMESTGVRNKIQCSSETADLLVAAGRDKWITPREDAISVRGKGTMQTYFLKVISGSKTSGETADTADTPTRLGTECREKEDRLVNWNVEVLSGLLRKILARRTATGKRSTLPRHLSKDLMTAGGMNVLDEVQEIISLPAFDGNAISKQVDPDSVKLDSKVVEELVALVAEFASMYRKNPFHSFEHASHVTMSVLKMLSRIENPKEIVATRKGGEVDLNMLESQLHDHTFGITSDPLSTFSVAFSALIHDLDHQGVPNATLVKEGSPLAAKYDNKSVAEQNSVDLAWDIFMSDRFHNLRSCICADEEEFKRFRQLVANVVMATDIMDKDLQAQRKNRWNKAFTEDESVIVETSKEDSVNRKATIVIEHLIQASDISHTMQHWHIYIKWNERFFHEMYLAYKQGRIENDPSKAWYQGEMGFFDFYIIPVAKKLFTCGVFGVQSDEFLNYAIINRKEWEIKGEEMVAQYLKNFKALYEGGDETEYEDVTERADDLDVLSGIKKIMEV